MKCKVQVHHTIAVERAASPPDILVKLKSRYTGREKWLQTAVTVKTYVYSFYTDPKFADKSSLIELLSSVPHTCTRAA